MTEAEWLAATDPTPMIYYVEDFINSQRKFILAVSAGCRRITQLLPDSRCGAAIDAAERFADGLAGENDLAAHQTQLRQMCRVLWDDLQRGGYVPQEHSSLLSCEAVLSVLQPALSPVRNPVSRFSVTVSALAGVRHAVQRATYERTQEVRETISAAVDEACRQVRLLRDIFGNPFRPVSLDPSWRTSTVLSLAEGIYAERAYDRLPILADALQDAGCDDPDILAHCQSGGVHVRGCWVVDLLLGKE
jgi:hypothetical protein